MSFDCENVLKIKEEIVLYCKIYFFNNKKIKLLNNF